MLATLDDVGRRISQLRVLVIGDVMLDTYYSGTSQRLCQEAPVPIVDITDRLDMPGGAGNCAANVAALGAAVTVLGVVGRDCEGDLARQRLEEIGVNSGDIVQVASRRTLSKSRVLCDNHLTVRFDSGSTQPIDAATESALLAALDPLFASVDAVIVSDYRYGVLTPAVIERLARLQAQSPRTLVVDSKSLPAYRHVGMTACKPNYRETLQLLGNNRKSVGTRRWHSLLHEGDRILQLTGARVAAVSLDCEGALFFEQGRPVHRTYAQAAPQERVAGAGDTFLSTLAVTLAAGTETCLAADLASTAAAVVVAKRHTATCSWQEVKQRYEGQSRPGVGPDLLDKLLQEYRQRGQQLVLTNGCFDILHRGHIAYLDQAKQLGDVLIVGINSDESIRRLKGPSRPINSLVDRVGVLQGLSSVDHVIAFEEDTPHQLIRKIKPDVFVKGGDYTRDTLPEAELVEELGGTIKILPFVPDRSTSSIISRICSVHLDADQ